jgi:hypothetical protein
MKRTYVLPALLLILFTAGCDSNSDVGSFEDLIGSWTLVSYRGNDLPALIASEDGIEIYMISGSLTVDADGSYRFEWNWAGEPCLVECDSFAQAVAGGITVTGDSSTMTVSQCWLDNELDDCEDASNPTLTLVSWTATRLTMEIGSEDFDETHSMILEKS